MAVGDLTNAPIDLAVFGFGGLGWDSGRNAASSKVREHFKGRWRKSPELIIEGFGLVHGLGSYSGQFAVPWVLHLIHAGPTRRRATDWDKIGIMKVRTPDPAEFRITKKPFYRSIGDEITLFESAYLNRTPVVLAGPTGCGKTRFVEFMAHRLKRPLITVACHEDLSAPDLLGRFLILGDETVWSDGPLTTAVRHGAIVYLDEVVEARMTLWWQSIL